MLMNQCLPDNEGGKRTVSSELVVLAIKLKVDLSSDRIIHVNLPIDHVVPRG